MEIYKRTPKGQIGKRNLVEGTAVEKSFCTSSSINPETKESINVKFNAGEYFIVLTREEIEFLRAALN